MSSSNSISYLKIIVTGGAGFIGSHAVDKFIELGHHVIVIDNFSTGRRENINQKSKVYQVDIRDTQTVERILKHEQPDIISHHAAQVNLRRSLDDPKHDAEENIIGLLSLLEACKKYSIKKFIFASSGGAVYGDQPLPVDENSLTQPTSPYGVSKCASEMYLQCYSHNYNLPYVSLRYSNAYGSRQHSSNEMGIIAILIQKILAAEPITIYGDGAQTRDYIHVNDIVQANVAALTTEFRGALNIGTGHETSLIHLLEQISSILETVPNVHFIPSRSEEQSRNFLNIGRANEILHWKPTIELHSGLKKTIEWYKTKSYL